jgi:hypothetical protein
VQTSIEDILTGNPRDIVKNLQFLMMSSSKIIVVILGILFFLMCGCGEQKGPPSQAQPLGHPESSEQKEFIQFPGLGVLEVWAQAIDEQLPTLVIRDAAKKVLQQIEMGHSTAPYVDSFKDGAGIGFKVFHISGLPSPLLMVATAGSGGSDHPWEVALIGVVSGKIKVLWKQTERLLIEGGIFVGDLGKDRGLGITQWSLSGYPLHSAGTPVFNIWFYLWNKEKSQFDVGPHFTIKNYTFEKIKKQGFRFPDLRHNFKRLEDFW